MSVQIDPKDLAGAVLRRPFAYVASAGSDGVAHLRAVVCEATATGFRFRIGQRTATNVERTGRITLVWPPLSMHEASESYDDHNVIADCEASVEVDGDTEKFLRVEPTSAVWHRPARS